MALEPDVFPIPLSERGDCPETWLQSLKVYRFTPLTVHLVDASQTKIVQFVLACALVVVFITMKSPSWSNQLHPRDVPSARGIPLLDRGSSFLGGLIFIRRTLERHGNIFWFKIINVGLTCAFPNFLPAVGDLIRYIKPAMFAASGCGGKTS
jgi:hypothetical protein